MFRRDVSQSLYWHIDRIKENLSKKHFPTSSFIHRTKIIGIDPFCVETGKFFLYENTQTKNKQQKQQRSF